MSESSLGKKRIDDVILKQIYDSDQSMYPASLRYDQLKEWVETCPDFSNTYYINESEEQQEGEQQKQPAGVVITLPIIHNYWNDVLIGKIREQDIVPSMLATNKDDNLHVGLHVFHVEKFGAWNHNHGSITKFTLADCTKTAIETYKWHVIGCSALAATVAGRKSFSSAGFVATGYEEIFLCGDDGHVQALFKYQNQDIHDLGTMSRGKEVFKAEMLSLVD